MPIGPQGHPVICQAGASTAGVDLAAEHADLVYAQLLSRGPARTYGAQLRERAVHHGRDAGAVRLVPGLIPVIGRTRAEALRRHEALHAAPGEEQLIADFTARAGLTGRRLDPDTVVRALAHADLVAHEEITLRQAVRRYEGGHRLVLGTPEDVAADIASWWEVGLADGFTLQPAVLPDDLERFVRLVVPILQHAGVYPRH